MGGVGDGGSVRHAGRVRRRGAVGCVAVGGVLEGAGHDGGGLAQHGVEACCE
jgi:hypothetical protein